MSLYLDASVVVALFVIDPSSARAEAFVSGNPEVFIISDFGAAEFSSAVARRVRTGYLTQSEGRLAFSNFDSWAVRSTDQKENDDCRYKRGKSDFAAPGRQPSHPGRSAYRDRPACRGDPRHL